MGGLHVIVEKDQVNEGPVEYIVAEFRRSPFAYVVKTVFGIETV